MYSLCCIICFFNDTALAEIYTLSLHDALPSYVACFDSYLYRMSRNAMMNFLKNRYAEAYPLTPVTEQPDATDRKSTRLNSSHANISYAVFCLKKNMLETYQKCYTTIFSDCHPL